MPNEAQPILQRMQRLIGLAAPSKMERNSATRWQPIAKRPLVATSNSAKDGEVHSLALPRLTKKPIAVYPTH
jgi:hypothetical protein